MPLRLAPLALATLDELPVDAYVVFVAEDERPLAGLGGLLDWRMGGGLSRLLKDGLLVGGQQEALLTTTNGALPAPRVLAFGLGPLSGITAERFSDAVRRALAALKKAQLARVAVGLPEQPPLKASARLFVDALPAGDPLDVTLLGDLQELALALPEVASRKR